MPEPPSPRRVLPIRWRIILPFALLTVTASALFGWEARRRVAERVERDIRGSLERLVRRLAASGAPLEGRYVPFMAELADARIFTLDGDLRLLAASVPPDERDAWQRELGLAKSPRDPAPGEILVGGRPYLVASAPVAWRGVGEAPALVLAAMPRSRVTETQRAATGPLLWLVALEGLAAIAIGAAVASSLTRPLGRLAAQARRIASGDLSGRVPAERDDEIGLLADTLDRMVSSLREAQGRLVHSERLAAVGRLAAGLVHEIRNPLSSIRMHVQILGRRPGVDAGTRDLLLSEIDRLDGILAELLDWSRPAPLAVAPVDLAALAEEALALMAPQLAHRGIRVLRELAPLPPVRADRDRMRQVLLNLLANARDALGTGGTLTVRVGTDGGGGAVLEVGDDGPGIPPGIRDRLFEPFVTGRKDGTGLGLAVVKRAVEEHAGSVSVETGPGGTRFRVVLPA